MFLKPAEQTPLVAGAMLTLARMAGFLVGVFNLIYASEGDAGGELYSNPKVRKISFTGSTEVGRLLMRQCSDQIKRTRRAEPRPPPSSRFRGGRPPTKSIWSYTSNAILRWHEERQDEWHYIAHTSPYGTASERIFTDALPAHFDQTRIDYGPFVSWVFAI
ncbi:hypothetical protein AJ88_28575 [Mesorhizobium amorphae CCBAU 01583]|nr:hypothetical protein AJ88_28575 [Mesorhizobium amorphae CCBAU 01583]